MGRDGLTEKFTFTRFAPDHTPLQVAGEEQCIDALW
jgi:hypothetical protein